MTQFLLMSPPLLPSSWDPGLKPLLTPCLLHSTSADWPHNSAFYFSETVLWTLCSPLQTKPPRVKAHGTYSDAVLKGPDIPFNEHLLPD